MQPGSLDEKELVHDLAWSAVVTVLLLVLLNLPWCHG